jgi:hypothetical protein
VVVRSAANVGEFHKTVVLLPTHEEWEKPKIAHGKCFSCVFKLCTLFDSQDKIL